MPHERFEWDRRKARANEQKHGVRFETAAEALSDPWSDAFHLDRPQRRGGEERWKTLASHPERRSVVLSIVWSERRDSKGTVTRIISARKATRRERQRYEREIF